MTNFQQLFAQSTLRHRYVLNLSHSTTLLPQVFHTRQVVINTVTNPYCVTIIISHQH